MLYIFHVDTGTTITFDIKLALQSVAQLKEAIERECGVIAAHQVLLMSGGESLEPNARVCSYSAGTDTNPIYLFSKAAIESHLPPSPNIDYGSDVDLQSQIDASLAMPATYQTLIARAQLAQQCCGLAREQTRICEKLVHDQHLQQQGWAAVVANLEDITQMFQSRVDTLQQSFSLYLDERQRHMELLENFNSDLGTLSKIMILPALRPHAEGLLSPDDQPTLPEDSQESDEQGLSLLRWISAKDNQSSLEQVAEQCARGLEQFDERVMEALKAEVNAAIDNANKQDMKEIKGLGDRLFALEQLMVQTKRLVHEQGELAQGFLQNQNRANNLGDASVLPDLCTSHRRQLQVMLQNHNQLRDIRRRCTKAKEELSVNIYHRLKWIMYVENKMMEVDGKLVMYHESLKRLRRHLEVLQQIHLAPQMYINAVNEVVRRRTFSQAFLVWASNLACQLLTVHTEELERRREFQSKFDGHFLNTLFPGLEDTPPPFATQAPSVFDNGLPQLTADDMESLKLQLPDLALTISTPDLSNITQFFLSKSLTDASTDAATSIGTAAVGTSTTAVTVTTTSTANTEPAEIGESVIHEESRIKDESTVLRVDVGISVNIGNGTLPGDLPKKVEGSEIGIVQMLTDRTDCESETDTEEFEKIGQGAADSKPNAFDGAKQKQREELEENLCITRTEVERLKSIFKGMKTVVSKALLSVGQEIDASQDRVDLEKCIEVQPQMDRVLGEVPEPSECIRRLREQVAQKQQEQEKEQEIRIDHELELEEVKKLMESREEEICAMKKIITEKDTELEEHKRLMSTIRHKLETAEAETRNLQLTLSRKLEENLVRARLEKSAAVKNANDERCMEMVTLTNSLARCQKRIEELEENLAAAHTEQQRAVKEAIDKLQVEHKTGLDAIRGRFKLMAASTMMERSPSESNLEKVERPEVIELANHETILAQTKEALVIEKSIAIRKAVEKESCVAKLNEELRMLRQMIEAKDKELESYKTQRQYPLLAECLEYKYAGRLTGFESFERPSRSEKSVVHSETRKDWTDGKLALPEGEVMEEKENIVLLISTIQKDLPESERLEKMSQSGSEGAAKGLDAEAEDVDVSGSKKVRLEADPNSLTSRLEILENDNKRLSSELQSIRESKEAAEAKVEALEADKVRLEIELVKQRTKRGITNESSLSTSSSSSSTDSRAKEMNASVAVVSESSGRDTTTAITEATRLSTPAYCFHTSMRMRRKLMKTASTLVLQGRITVSSCKPGDYVLVLWDAVHSNYALFQESATLYFINSESVSALGLNLDGTQRKTIAEVVSKEYCHAKRHENRYHVPLGTKFYRVHVKPASINANVPAMTKSRQ